MSLWAERILKEFPADLARLWIASDPDDVLLDEHILSGLRTRGFEVLPFEDSVVFRSEYEERYRQRVLHQLSRRAEKLGMKLVATEQPA